MHNTIPRPRWLGAAGLALVLACGGCSSRPVKETRVVADQLGSAAQQPLEDANLRNKAIPLVLVRAVRAPYAVPPYGACDNINAEIRELNRVLGPDFDAPKPGETTMDRMHRMTDDIARDAASSWIPFRGVVRWITGAERHSRDAAAAILAGSVRRGYLKGVRSQRGC